ncbi:MAG: hypothetical protein R3E10_14075 [Gemmatimonadota bacterium]
MGTLRAPLWLLIGSLLVLTSCADRRWSPEEIENAQHLLNAQQADVIAERMGSMDSPHATPGDAMTRAVLEHRREALRQARLVRDDVLEKARPGLSQQFRDTFERGLELLIEGAETGDADLQSEGAQLHQAWIDWSHEHGSEILIPQAAGIEVAPAAPVDTV